ncbi:unnamed protein product [Cyberlindnera jadinii]|uniref:Uncharacterized protein n=1 Tax=Cyberlindnera jadinii (strain ATCC 18201 / CBS 1600 / BCRC 20928 / JCM 3617 / NBRC 0987 / NRRL Y-1542) TaxID=983966 RepID=A0A0H5C233_CYBJN|nr:unnamed protein product [Cyberlindnera jadinii]
MPQTSEDYLEEAISKEEYADRWLLSDVAKSLRAYQESFDYYSRSIALSNGGSSDHVYNRLRLLFHVYETYKDVPKSMLTGCDGCTVHLTGLQGVMREYQAAGWVNWECAYNQVLLNMEAMEQEGVMAEQVVGLLNGSIALINSILKVQLLELDSFLQRLEAGESETPTETQGEGDMYEQIVPSTVLDTLITAWRMVFTAMQSCDTLEELRLVAGESQVFLGQLDDGLKLLERFAPGNDDPFQLNIKQGELDELSVVKSCIYGIQTVELAPLVNLWESMALTTSSKWLAQADSFITLLSFVQFSEEDQWTVISHALKALKLAQDTLTSELNEEKSAKGARVSALVGKIVEVLISRADNELLRASLTCDAAVQHRDTLKSNAINLLKSGLNYSQSNVGLREPALDKIQRNKLKRECVVRLLILTKDALSVEDLVRNLGMEFWESEWTEMRSHPLYSKFPIVSTV